VSPTGSLHRLKGYLDFHDIGVTDYTDMVVTIYMPTYVEDHLQRTTTESSLHTIKFLDELILSG
jgi:hypothetical protein